MNNSDGPHLLQVWVNTFTFTLTFFSIAITFPFNNYLPRIFHVRVLHRPLLLLLFLLLLLLLLLLRLPIPLFLLMLLMFLVLVLLQLSLLLFSPVVRFLLIRCLPLGVRGATTAVQVRG
jgi:hypothetical protein